MTLVMRSDQFPSDKICDSYTDGERYPDRNSTRQHRRLQVARGAVHDVGLHLVISASIPGSCDASILSFNDFSPL